MITPFIPDELFEINESPLISFDNEYQVIYVDNFFKNYEDITNVLHNTSVERWKTAENTRNFIDYYDCRMVINNPYPSRDLINRKINFYYSLISNYLKETNPLEFKQGYHFNYFKNKKYNLDSKYQHYPHKDLAYNIIHYMDSFSNGGTAIYKDINIENREEYNLFYDTSNLKIKKIIEAKPNRCVIFKGNVLHGGYINNHNIYCDNWRINLVNFVTEVSNGR